MADNRNKRPINEQLRELLAELDRLIRPQPQPVPVPIPVRVRPEVRRR